MTREVAGKGFFITFTGHLVNDLLAVLDALVIHLLKEGYHMC